MRRTVGSRRIDRKNVSSPTKTSIGRYALVDVDMVIHQSNWLHWTTGIDHGGNIAGQKNPRHRCYDVARPHQVVAFKKHHHGLTGA